jgi:hypothetical protein
MQNDTAYFAINRNNKTVVILTAPSWPEVQRRFQYGIRLPDGHNANGIGRCKASEFKARAAKSGFAILS